MNSFIPWIGGKSQLRKDILSIFPSVEIKSYIEVFGGAGWILFAKEKHALLEVFNDIDGNLVNLYRCIKHHCKELQRELKLCENHIPINSREMFLDYQEQMATRGFTDIQRAAMYFYLIRVSYGADHRTFGCNKKTLLTAIDRLPEIQKRLQNVVVENQDFEKIMKTYNRSGSLFYLDPPYYNAEKYYQGFSPDDHLRLFECIKKLKGYFILSYNDDMNIRNIYNKFSIKEVERSNSLAAKKGGVTPTYKELIITNF